MEKIFTYTKCANCLTKVTDKDRVCPNCGADLRQHFVKNLVKKSIIKGVIFIALLPIMLFIFVALFTFIRAFLIPLGG